MHCLEWHRRTRDKRTKGITQFSRYGFLCSSRIPRRRIDPRLAHIYVCHFFRPQRMHLRIHNIRAHFRSSTHRLSPRPEPHQSMVNIQTSRADVSCPVLRPDMNVRHISRVGDAGGSHFIPQGLGKNIALTLALYQIVLFLRMHLPI